MNISVLTTLLLASTVTFSMPSIAQSQGYQAPYHTQFYEAPKPMTEKVLKHRLNAQLSFTKQQLAFDKNQADAYAAQFVHLQKQQAAALYKMMIQAEKQREYTLKRLEMQHQLILNQFSKFQVASDQK